MVLKYLFIGATFLTATYSSNIFKYLIITQKVMKNPFYNYGIPHIFFVFSMIMANYHTPFPFYLVFPLATFAGISILDKYYQN